MVQERLLWNYSQSKRTDFADRMVSELYRKGVLVMFQSHQKLKLPKMEKVIT